MRRSAAYFLSSMLVAAVAAGCQKPKQDEDLQEPPPETAMMQPDYYTTDPAGAVAGDDYQTSDNYVAESTAEQTVVQTPDQGGRTHVVVKGDTLYGLARRYYHDQRRWRDIFAANSGEVKDPDVIYVGQVLVIP